MEWSERNETEEAMKKVLDSSADGNYETACRVELARAQEGGRVSSTVTKTHLSTNQGFREVTRIQK